VDDQVRKRGKTILWGAAYLGAVAALAAVVVQFWRSLQAKKAPSVAPEPLPPIDVRGLTEEEAAARHEEGQDNAIYFQPPRSRQQIWRENVYNVFNFSLLGLAFAQLLLGRYLDVLLSILGIGLNIGINIGQEMIARRRVQAIEADTRPQATVIRDDKIRSIDPSGIVRGDMLIVGPGDQLLVDGEVVGEGKILVDETMLAGERSRRTARAGDKVYAGSFCISGRAAYQAQKVGDERRITTLIDDAQVAEAQLTPLERIVERVMWVLLVIVLAYAAIALAVYFRLNLPVDSQVINDLMSVVFNVAPASLYFVIILTYVSGTADLAKLGALVHRARSVESMAQTTTICLAKAGILTSIGVEIEPVVPPEGQEGMAESRLRQILGDYGRTISVDSLPTTALTTAFEGNRRTSPQQAPYLAVYGWSAIAFDDEDLQGIFVLGEPEALEGNLVQAPEEAKVEAEEEPEQPRMAALGRVFTPMRRLFRRRAEEASEAEDTAPGRAEALETVAPPADDRELTDDALVRHDVPSRHSGSSAENVPSSDDTSSEEESDKDGFFGRLRARVTQVIRREERPSEEEEGTEEAPVQRTTFLFAYFPDQVPLHAADGAAQLPDGLIPLCRLHYEERVRPEAIETVNTFARSGMDIKVFSPDSPDQIAAVISGAGLTVGDGEAPGFTSGDDLAAMNPQHWTQAVADNSFFGKVSPDQARQIVSSLRQDGETVAMLGDAVSDVPAMQQANLAIARRSSSQSALSVAEIVLLEDSAEALLKVLDKGQRIVNGLLDVLKLQLTQVSYLALLILLIPIVARGYPYQSVQGTVIVVATVSLPSVGLTLWAAPGVMPRANLSRILARFIIPAAPTIAVAALIVYVYFLNQSGSVVYAQLVTTHSLVVIGLLLVVFVKPPWPRRVDGQVQAGDWRPTVLAIVLLLVFWGVTNIPLAQELLKLSTLDRPEHYLFIGAVAVVWAIAVGLVWGGLTLVRNLPILRREETESGAPV
jgi:magnesium-transporting ATPase (P-type)